MALPDSKVNITLNSLNSVRKIEDVFINNLSGTMRKLERQLTDLLQGTRITKTVDVALARSNIETILLNSGYFEATGQLVNEGYQQAIEQSYQQYKSLYNKSFQLGEVSMQRLNSLKQLDLNNFAGLSSSAVNEANRLFVDMQFGAISRKQAIDILREQVIDKMQRHAETWVTTGMSGVYRETNVALAVDNGIEKFQYIGPYDSITRDFCRKVLESNRTYTVDEINALNNRQGLNVLQYGGGYNCRHQWVGVVE